MCAAVAGGFLGVAADFFVIVYALPSTILGFGGLQLFVGLFFMATFPIVGGVCSIWASTVAGRFLDRYD